jgi:hypothetical protein
MKTVYFLVQGQFGNNLFQYFAAEIIKKIYGYDEVKPTFYINLEFNTVIEDPAFKTICARYMSGNIAQIDTSKDILMMGFFQRSEIFEWEREFVRGLFHKDNMNNISNRIKIGNIVTYQTKHTVQPTAKDLTLHLRCGDFWDHEKKQSQIFDPNYIKEIVKSIPYDKLYIVANKSEHAWEKEYYDHFEELNPIWINGNLGDDFDFLMKSNQIVTSASTMSYLAAYLGNASIIHIPYNYFYGGAQGDGQHLAEFNDKCIVHYRDEYWVPQKIENKSQSSK